MLSRRRALVALLALATAGCSRAIVVGSSTPGATGGSTFAINVTNMTGTSMDVFFTDGSEHPLGTVANGKAERFIIAGAKQTIVNIIGRANAGSRQSGPYQVNLQAGGTASVTLR
jgi:hypothetical protein